MSLSTQILDALLFSVHWPLSNPFSGKHNPSWANPWWEPVIDFRKMWAVEKKLFVTASQSPASASWVCGGRAYKEAWTGWEPCLNADVSPESLWLPGCTAVKLSCINRAPRPCVSGEGAWVWNWKTMVWASAPGEGLRFSERYFPNYKIPTGAASQAHCMLYIRQGLKSIL